MCYHQYFLLHIYKHFRHYRGTCRLHSPTGQVASRTVLQNLGTYTSMGPKIILAPLQDLVPTLSGAYSCHYSLICVWALHFKLVKFVSSRLESIKLQTPLMEIK
jgi:hypothetical protein